MKIPYYEVYEANTFLTRSNFFAEKEVIDIRQRVHALKDYWQVIGNPLYKYLPIGVYLRDRFPTYDRDLQMYRQLMWENFGPYYIQLKQYINAIFDVPCDYSPVMCYPGFHIFGPGEDGIYDRIRIRDFHQDLDYPFPPNVKEGEIFSFVVPIQLPRLGECGLTYKLGREEHEIQYEVNKIISWSGMLQHTFGPFQLSDASDYRITLQAHVNVIENKGIIFW